MENFLLLAETEANAAVVIFNLLVSFLLGVAIAIVYRKTHQGLSYSQQFLTTLVLLSVLGSVVMMVVSQNLIGAFALLGAFSLIRFRTILKETRDIAFVFFALVIGVAVGVNSYVVAVLGTIVVSVFIFILQRFNFGSALRGSHLVVIVADESFSPREGEVLHVKTLPDGSIEYTLDVKFKDERLIADAIRELKRTSGVRDVTVMSGRGSVEY